MKKLVFLPLAAIMALSLGIPAFASMPTPNPTGSSTLAITSPNTNTNPSEEGVDRIYEYGYIEDDDGLVAIGDGTDVASIPAGETVYYPLLTRDGNFVAKSDSVKSASLSTKYTLGQNSVSSPRVVYKKYDYQGTAGYAYMLAIATNERTSTTSADFAADITIKKTSGTGSDNLSLAFNMVVGVSFDIGYPITTDTIYKEVHRLDVVDGEGEITLDFDEAPDCTFEVDATGQDDILVAFNTTYNSTIAAKYPQANLDFYNGSGANFNKIGTLTLAAEEGSYIYLANSDNSLSEVNNCTYDDGENAFKIATRTLGKYVVSDIELDTTGSGSASSNETETSEPDLSEAPAPTEAVPTMDIKENPGTGIGA